MDRFCRSIWEAIDVGSVSQVGQLFKRGPCEARRCVFISIGIKGHPDDAIRFASTAIYREYNLLEKIESKYKRTIGILLTLAGFSDVSAVLLGWVPGWQNNAGVILGSLVLLFIERHLSVAVGGSASVVARSATATAVTLLFLAAAAIAILVAIALVLYGYFLKL